MNELFHPRAAIFDLDGTLADTFGVVISSYVAATREYLGRDLTREEVIARFGPTEHQMLRKDVPAEMYDRAVAHFRQCYRDNHTRLVRIFEGIPEMLQALKERGIPMAIMTGKGRDTADITLASLGWTTLFQSVVTGDESPRAKPAPDGVLMAAHALGVDAKRVPLRRRRPRRHPCGSGRWGIHGLGELASGVSGGDCEASAESDCGTAGGCGRALRRLTRHQSIGRFSRHDRPVQPSLNYP